MHKPSDKVRSTTLTIAILLGSLPACAGSGVLGGGDPELRDGVEAPDAGDATQCDGEGEGDASASSFTPRPFGGTFMNPERGFYRRVGDITTTEGKGNLAAARANRSTLAFSVVRLDDWRSDASLPDSWLEDLRAGFTEARLRGVKLILRFSYGTQDAPQAIVLSHLERLRPVLQTNGDVIAVMQAGFIGEEGQWHDSANNLLDDFWVILDKILWASPKNRMVQVGFPWAKYGYTAAPIGEAEAYSDLYRARLGHHNDCLLTESYEDKDLNYVAADTKFVAMGAEPCTLTDQSAAFDCTKSIETMSQTHFSYISENFSPEVLDSWRASGCYQDVDQRLGYRFRMTSLSFAENVRPGGVLPLNVEVTNDGFAAPYNERPVTVVLSGPGYHELSLDEVDPRWWFAGQTQQIAARLQLPADIAPGEYELALRFPDAATPLWNDARYSIRLANEDVWDEEHGRNILGSVTVEATASGSCDPMATSFSRLP